jgi:adenylate kinase family enzyme
MAGMTLAGVPAPPSVGMRRVIVIGCAGAGKSVFSRRLGERLGLPVTHLDRLYWRPGWQEPPRDEWRRTIDELVRGDQWLIDGNYSGTLETRLRAADTVIWLDMPRRVCLSRVVKRWATHPFRRRPDLPEGCRERLDRRFLKWVWDYPSVTRPAMLAALARKRDGRVIVLRSNRDIEEFLALTPPHR